MVLYYIYIIYTYNIIFNAECIRIFFLICHIYGIFLKLWGYIYARFKDTACVLFLKMIFADKFIDLS